MGKRIDLISEKQEQVIKLLREHSLDAWLIFVRESEICPDPCLELLVGQEVTWQSAFLFFKSGEKIALVGNFDVEKFKRLNQFEVIGYTEGLKSELLKVLQRLNPHKIGINFSLDDVTADGLSYGMFLILKEALEGTDFSNRVVSAERVIMDLRGRKTKTEIFRVRKAIRTTEKLFDKITRKLKPGVPEKQIANFLHQELEVLNLETAWSKEQCPAVNFGPHSAVGHTGPTNIKLEKGHLVHLDFGVKQEGYCSDLQRMWYKLDNREKRAPESVQRAFVAVAGAIQQASQFLKPGVQGFQVDKIARDYLRKNGYPEYKHALGHQMGQFVHDGGTILGPLWERYRNTPYYEIKEGNVFTLELGVMVADYGYLSLEEDVLVTKNGCQFLSLPQKKLICV